MINILEENKGKLHDSGLVMIFFLDALKSTDNQNKKGQMGLYQNKNLLQRNNQLSEETTFRMIKNICKPRI